MKDYLYPLRRLHGQLYEQKLGIKKMYDYWRYINCSNTKKVLILGTPLHTNIGDSAIVIAEIALLIKMGIPVQMIKEVATEEVKYFSRAYKFCYRKTSCICWHGGGNMGDQWFAEEKKRRQVIAAFPDRDIIIFPQTLFYTNSVKGKIEEKQSVSIYNSGKIRLMARERASEKIMKSLYPKARIERIPDIVLFTTIDDYGVQAGKREGVLWCMRSDAERALSDQFKEMLYNYIVEFAPLIKKTDMHSDKMITQENREMLVRSKLEEFVHAELVVTDRLHGMVFAAITGTPCVVWGNYNHKVRGTYEWIEYLPYIRFAESLEDAKAIIPELMAMGPQHYDNTPLIPYYEKLKCIINEMR